MNLLQLPSSFDINTHAGSNYTVWRGPLSGDGCSGLPMEDQTSLALREVNVSVLTGENFLTEIMAPWQDGYMRLEYLQKEGKFLADARIAQALYKQRDQCYLENIYTKLGISCIEFYGTIMRYSINRGAYFVYLLRDEEEGGWDICLCSLTTVRTFEDKALVL